MDYTELGLTLTPDFISEGEAHLLLQDIAPAMPAGKRKVHNRNAVRRYGSREPYFDNIVSATIPPHLDALCNRLVLENLVTARPDSVTINEYYTGQIIEPHIDHVDAGPVITILSLGSPATMIFTRNTERFEVVLPPRSLVQMRNQIRYGWKHEIAPVPGLRYSLVFRNSADCKNK